MKELMELVQNKKIKRSELPIVYKLAIRKWAENNDFLYNKKTLTVTMPSEIFRGVELENDTVCLYINIWIDRKDRIFLRASNTKYRIFLNLGYLLNIEHTLLKLKTSEGESV